MSHFRHIIVFAMLATFAGCAKQEVASSKKVLRWRFQPGMKFHVLMDTSIDRDIKGEADQIRVTTQSLVDLLCCVESIDDSGAAQITLSYKRMRLKTKSPDGNVDIDTAAIDDNLPGNAATGIETLKEAAFNISYRFSVDNRGQILSLETNDKRSQPSKHKLPALTESLSEERIRQTLRAIFLILPEASLTVGDTWDDTKKSSLPGLSAFQEANVKYLYAGPSPYENKMFEKITTEATLEWGETPAGVGAKIMSQENPGTIYFDADAGRLVECENHQKMISEYTIEGRVAQEQLTVTSKVEVKAIK